MPKSPKSPKVPKASTVSDAVAALDSVRGSWLRRPGVTAVDVGFKIAGDEMTDTVALRVHVERKRPAASLASEDVFNDPDTGPDEVGGFEVDVVEAAYSPSGVVLDHEDLAAVDGGWGVGGKCDVPDESLGSCADRLETASIDDFPPVQDGDLPAAASDIVDNVG